MSVFSKKPLTPGNVMFRGIALFICAIVALIMAVVTTVQSVKMKSRCSEKAAGTIISVEDHYHHGRRASYTEYRATIAYSSGDNEGVIITDWSDDGFVQGDTVLVCYDPNDLSVGYAASSPPQSGLGQFICAIIFTLLGWYCIRLSRRMPRPGNDTDTDMDMGMHTYTETGSEQKI